MGLHRTYFTLVVMLAFATAPTTSAQDLDDPAAGERTAGVDARLELERLGVPFAPHAFLEHSAAGRDDVVGLFLRGEMQPDVTDSEDQTPLIHAAFAGSTLSVERLLAAGADVDHRDMHAATALMYAASEGHLDVVRLLLEASADPNLADAHHGWSPLMYASFEGRDDVARLLLESGADPNFQDERGRFSPLMMAAYQGFPEVVELLVEAGADPDVQNIFGQSASILAASRGFQRIVDMLE